MISMSLTLFFCVFLHFSKVTEGLTDIRTWKTAENSSFLDWEMQKTNTPGPDITLGLKSFLH